MSYTVEDIDPNLITEIMGGPSRGRERSERPPTSKPRLTRLNKAFLTARTVVRNGSRRVRRAFTFENVVEAARVILGIAILTVLAYLVGWAIGAAWGVSPFLGVAVAIFGVAFLVTRLAAFISNLIMRSLI